MEVGVHVSCFKIRKKRSGVNSRLPLFSNLAGFISSDETKNIKDLLKEFYQKYNEAVKVDELSKLFSTKSNSLKVIEKNETIYISFTIKCGVYGIKSDITNIENNKVVFRKKINNADVKDFRIMFVFKKDNSECKCTKGLILFEVLGQYGIKDITTKIFNNFLGENYNLVCDIRNVVTKDAYKSILRNGNVKKLSLIKNKPSPTFNSMFGINTGKEVRTVYLSRFKRSESLIEKLFSLTTNDDDVYELDERFDEIDLTVNMNGRTKTINIKNIDSLYIIDQLSSNVIDKDGNMIVDRIDDEMIEHSNDYLKSIVDGENNDEVYS